MLRFKKPDGSEYPDWKTIGFDDVMTIANGMVMPSDYPKLPHIGPGNIEKETGRLLEYNLAEDDNLISGKYLFDEEDIIYGKINPQFAKVVLPGFKGLCSADAYPIKASNGINPRFLFYVLLGKRFTQYAISVSKRTGMPKINRDDLLRYNCKFPCIEEQQKIADCLSSVDSVIADYEAQVENMQNQKKGVMQKLFSQEVRFRADDGNKYPEWETPTLESIGSFYGGLSGKTKDDFGKGTGKFVTYMNVYKNTFASQEMLEAVDVGNKEHQNTVSYGDILMSQSSETVEEVGLSSVYLYDDEPYLNSFCFGFSLNDLNMTYPQYMGYLMRSDAVRKQIMREGQGISRINLSPNRIRNIKLSIPCLEEQQKIADCLSAFDDTIEDLQKTVERWKNIKKGLLQQLFA